MKLYALSRSLHKWIATITLIPLLLVFATGIALSVSPQIDVLQPKVPPRSEPGITLSFDEILSAAQTIPESGIRSWSDVTQIDARPKAGIVRIRSKNYWEIQIDGQTGEILRSARRWKTFLIVLHDGAWFGTWVRYGIFAPSGVGALALSITGLVLLIIPFWRKRKKTQ